MGLADDLRAVVRDIFRTQWTSRDGLVVPGDADLKLGNDAVKLEATVLYADLADSTKLVDANSLQPSFPAEIYKTFLHCAAKVIRHHDGEITAYDGDRVMAVFVGDLKNTRAVKTALKIAWAVADIVQVELKDFYKHRDYIIRHVTGVDTSSLLVARTGIRGSNDLVWVGRAANYAAKLAALPPTHAYITKEVYDSMADEAKISKGGANMWEAVQWNTFDNRTIYRSGWKWPLSLP